MKDLFDSSAFFTRDFCGDWSGGLAFAHQAAHGLTAISYFAIPIWILLIYRSRHRDIPANWMMLLFFTFILSCGVGHLCNVAVFYWPAYRLFTLIDWVVAAASVTTVVLFPRFMREAAAYPSWTLFAKKVKQLEEALAEAGAAKAKAEAAERRLGEMIDERNQQIAEQSALIRELRHGMKNLEGPIVNQREIILALQSKLEEIRKIGRSD